MKIVVHDACALIDLLKAGLVEAWVQCGIEIHTTELALLEVNDDSLALDHCGALEIRKVSSSDLVSLLQFKESCKALSLEDCSVFKLAESLKVPLLTGDKDLRRFAERAGVKVHGMLWVLDTLVERELITCIAAVGALELLVQQGSRFPRDEVEERFSRWRNQEDDQ